jgi:hypothetical protein
MPYIGNPIYQSAFVVDQFSGNGSTTAFTMSVAPAGVTNVLVAVSGVLQDPSTYGVVGNTITFSAAPPSGTGNISCRYLGVPASGVTTTAYRTVTEFTATASQTTFTPPSYTVGFINVYLNGVLLGSADYTATNGTTVVLATGAAAGNLLTVESFLVSSVLNAIPATSGSVGASNLAAGSVVLSSSTVTGVLPIANGGSGSSTAYLVEYLVVGGGGAGGFQIGGGGGAGGVVSGSVYVITGSGYTVTIGAGGTVVNSNSAPGNSGGNSSFASAVAFGGGGGGSNGNGAQPNSSGSGLTGGCGGGAGEGFYYGYGIQGYPGGVSFPTSNYGSGGGGGATAQGGHGTTSVGGNGGTGTNAFSGWASATSTGASGFYAGGGAGGGYNPGTAGTGGSGGGGDGGTAGTGYVGVAGTANTGGGGGGGSYDGTDHAGGAGGSGIVIVRYPGAARATGGTIVTTGGYTYHTFTSSGTYTA